MNGYRLDYERYMEVFDTYHKNRLNNNNIVSQIDKSRDKDEMLQLALKLIGFFIGDDYFCTRNLDKFE